MAIVPTYTTLAPESSAVSLPRYAQVVQADECAVYGVRRDSSTYPAVACKNIWVKRERDAIINALWQAQGFIEPRLGYPLLPTYFANEQHTWRGVNGFPARVGNGYILSGGIKATTLLAAGETVDHTTDPAVVGPIALGSVTDVSEVHVYYPATLAVEGPVEIHPSDVDIDTVAQTITIYIPRCRMVTPAVADNTRSGIDYNVLANFLATVDVYRVYTDTSTQGCLVWKAGCDPGCDTTSSPCAESTQTACIHVKNSRLGMVELSPSSYVSGAWVNSYIRCERNPDLWRASYVAGRWSSLEPGAEQAIIRLAHVLLPLEPCWCEFMNFRWKQDTFTPQVVTRERYNNPFGMSDGAWYAWTWTNEFSLEGKGK